jgi:hypothetical protein
MERVLSALQGPNQGLGLYHVLPVTQVNIQGVELRSVLPVV